MFDLSGPSQQCNEELVLCCSDFLIKLVGFQICYIKGCSSWSFLLYLKFSMHEYIITLYYVFNVILCQPLEVLL